ncbi:MAG: TonB-dependent receptor [Chitinophagaceae bacterium]|nr:TonB-dependent receptor [Chitinophagaceae bacterium]
MKHTYGGLAAVMLLVTFNLFYYNTVAQKTTSTYSLSGKVTDNLGVPLQGASIYVPDLRRGTIADAEGKFVITGLPAGNYYVEASFAGYKTQVLPLNFDKSLQVDFKLEISVTEDKEIVITGVSQATTLKRNPLPVVNVSRQLIQQSLTTNIINVIASVPGVAAVTTGPNVAKPFIRGLGFNRVVTLFDGIRLEGQQWGDEHGVEIDENTVDRAEVVKGPASLLYGSDALAGVVNLFPAQVLPSDKGKGNVALEYQTNNNQLEGTVNLAKNTGPFSWSLVGTQKIAADYQNKVDGRVYNTGFNQSSLFFQSTLNKSWGFSRIGASFLNLLQEIPDGNRDSASRKFLKPVSDDDEFEIVSKKELRSYKISPVHQLVRHITLYNSTSLRAGSGRVLAGIGWQKNIRKEFESVEEQEAELSLGLSTLTYDVKYLSGRLGDIRLTGGVNGLLQNNRITGGEEFLIPEFRQFDLGPFLFARYNREKLQIDGGIRMDFRHVNADALYVKEVDGEEVPVTGIDTVGAERLFANYSNNFTGLSGSIGFSYRVDEKWNLKLNVARGFRAPNIPEITSNGIHAGSRIYQLGNSNLKPEFSFQQDLGVTYSAEHVTIGADIFNNQIQNYIFNTKLVNAAGEDTVVVPGYETFRYTASRAHLWGGEFLIDLHPHPLDWLHFENSFSFILARNLGTKTHGVNAEEKYLPFIPPLHGKSELRASFREWKQLENIFIKLQLELFAAQNRFYAMNATESRTAGYQLLNFGVGAGIINKKGVTVLNLSLLCNNVLNAAYQSHLSRLKYFEEYPDHPGGRYGIYGMGRNVSLKLSVPFNI